MINTFIDEIKRCEYFPLAVSTLEERTYNGITYVASTESYNKKLSKMLSDFKTACLTLPQEERRILIKEVDALKGVYYDVPGEEEIQAMQNDYEASKSKSLKYDIEFCLFLKSMAQLQIYYREEAYNFLQMCCGGDSNVQTIKETEIKTETKDKSENVVIEGVKGLATFLGIGNTLAQAVINNKVLMEDGTQYKVGKKWIFDKLKLKKLLENNPEILKNIHTKPHK